MFKKDSSILVVKVIAIGMNEVKYKDFTNQNGDTFTINHKEIVKIKFESGKVELYGDYLDGKVFENNRKNAMKVDFLSPIFGKTTFSYERSLKPGASLEFQLGIIGAGIDEYMDNKGIGALSRGAFIKAGIKFINMPQQYVLKQRYAHRLKGFYIRPEITFGRCIEQRTTQIYAMGDIIKKQEVVYIAAFMMNIGKQWVIKDKHLFDFFCGIGLGYKSNNDHRKDWRAYGGNVKDKSLFYGNSHAFLGPYDNIPFALGCGIKYGILF